MDRIDWEGLKQEFIVYRKISLRAFAELKGLNYNGYFSRKTKGWIQEKNQRLSKIREEVIKKLDEKQINKQVSVHEKFSKLINNLYNEIEEKLNDRNLLKGAKGIDRVDSLLKATGRLYKLYQIVEIDNNSQNNGCLQEMFAALHASNNICQGIKPEFDGN